MDRDAARLRAARESLRFVGEGMVVGLGTGRTASLAIRELGARVREGLRIRGVATSEATAELARSLDIPLVSLEEVPALDLTIDGADEIDRAGNAIKGGGGALCREKIVSAATSGLRVAVIESPKLVERLGKFPLPVEVLSFARPVVARWIAALGAEVSWRRDPSGAPYLTDNGNPILDCRFSPRDDWPELAAQLDALPGLVCHGIFVRGFDVIVIGKEEETEVLRVASSSR